MSAKLTSQSGYVIMPINSNASQFAYDFKDGFITLHFFDSEQEKVLNNNDYIHCHEYGDIGTSLTLYHLDLPLRVDESGFPRNVKQSVSWSIKGYQPKSVYTAVSFSFPELDYFFTKKLLKWDKDSENYSYDLKPVDSEPFNIKIHNKDISVRFITHMTLRGYYQRRGFAGNGSEENRLKQQMHINHRCSWIHRFLLIYSIAERA